MVRPRSRAISNAEQPLRTGPGDITVDEIARALWRHVLDEMQTSHVSQGRLRIIPLLGVSADITATASEAHTAPASALFEELKRVREDLAQAAAERDSLQRQLDDAKGALAWAQVDMGSRTFGGLQTWSLGTEADVETQRQQRVRLASRLDAARKMAGRHGPATPGAAETLGRLASWALR